MSIIVPSEPLASEAIAKIVARYPERNYSVTLNHGSSWVHCDIEPAWCEDAEPAHNHEQKFAIWRSTGDIYRVGEDGAVGDDPVPDNEL